MKGKNIKFYSIYFLALFSYIIGMGVLLNRISMDVRGEFKFYIFYVAEISVVVVFGFLIGVEHLYKQMIKDEQWKIDGARLLMLGLPCLILVIWNQAPYFLVMIWFENISLPSLPYPLNIILFNRFSSYAMTTLMSYIVTTSFYKEQTKYEESL